MNTQAVGWDLHRKFSTVTVAEMSTKGQMQVRERARLEHAEREGIRRWLSGLKPGTPVALEAAFGWPWVADLLEQCGLEPHLAHPPAMRELAKHEAKGDRCDADRLAKFQLRGILPESYLAPPEVRQVRERIRYRTVLVLLRTGLKNRIQATLHRLGILHPFSDLFGQKGRAFLEQLSLPEASREVLDAYLRLLDAVGEEVTRVETWMEENLEIDEAVRLLKSIPGIGLILAYVIRAEIGEIDRFPSRRHLNSYAGVAPLSDDSAGRHGARHCSPACNHILRWALIEAAGGVLRSRGDGHRLRRLHARLTHGGRANKSQAKVAVARELAQLVYIVLTKQEPYTETPPARPGATPQQSPVASPRKAPKRTNPETKTTNPRRKTTLRSDQPRHPMVRPRGAHTAGQTLT